MKKLVLHCLLLLASITAVAQTVNLPKGAYNFPCATPSSALTHGSTSEKQGGMVDAWFDPEDFIRNNTVGPFENFVNIMFPDSNVVTLDGNNVPNNVFTHAFGHMFDLRYDLWAAVPSNPGETLMPFAQKDNYMWDSASFAYLYRRNHPDPAVVDTAFVYYYRSSLPNQVRRSSIIFVPADTMVYSSVQGLDQKRLSGTSFFKVDTILLTIADTTSLNPTGWTVKLKTLSVNVPIQGTNANSISTNPNSLFGFTVTYKPGHAYNAGDTLEARGTRKPVNGVNYFGFRYAALSIDFPTNMRSRTYFENSLMLTNETRYGQTTAGGWSGFMPGTAFNDAIYANTFARVSGVSTLSKKEIETRGFSLGKVYPNPVKTGGAVHIEYGLKADALVTIEVYDLLGKQVATVCNEKAEAGEHTATFSNSLAPGMYVYTMKVDGAFAGSEKFQVIQ